MGSEVLSLLFVSDKKNKTVIHGVVLLLHYTELLLIMGKNVDKADALKVQS